MKHAFASIKDECSASFMKNMHQNENKNKNENENSPSTLYNETYKEKNLERMKNQVFDVEEKEELSDIKCLAEFYRDFFKEFVCSLRGGGSDERRNCVEIRYTLLSLDELDQDLDFDELHYSRILGEFRRILDIYAKELSKSLDITVQICENQNQNKNENENENGNKKSRIQRTYSCQNGWIKYGEQFV